MTALSEKPLKPLPSGLGGLSPPLLTRNQTFYLKVKTEVVQENRNANEGMSKVP